MNGPRVSHHRWLEAQVSTYSQAGDALKRRAVSKKTLEGRERRTRRPDFTSLQHIAISLILATILAVDSYGAFFKHLSLLFTVWPAFLMTWLHDTHIEIRWWPAMLFENRASTSCKDAV